jgi:DNA repair protein RadC
MITIPFYSFLLILQIEKSGEPKRNSFFDSVFMSERRTDDKPILIQGGSNLSKESLRIHNVPREDRPRERLILKGARSLSNHELIAILLQSGTKEESVLQLANRLLNQFEGLRMLKDATLEEITSIKGIGRAKAVQIMAALELGRRIHSLSLDERYVIRSPEDGANYVMQEMRFLTQEHFVCV